MLRSSGSPSASAVSPAFCANVGACDTMNSMSCVAFSVTSRRATSQPTRHPVMQ